MSRMPTFFRYCMYATLFAVVFSILGGLEALISMALLTLLVFIPIPWVIFQFTAQQWFQKIRFTPTVGEKAYQGCDSEGNTFIITRHSWYDFTIQIIKEVQTEYSGYVIVWHRMLTEKTFWWLPFRSFLLLVLARYLFHLGKFSAKPNRAYLL